MMYILKDYTSPIPIPVPLPSLNPSPDGHPMSNLNRNIHTIGTPHKNPNFHLDPYPNPQILAPTSIAPPSTRSSLSPSPHSNPSPNLYSKPHLNPRPQFSSLPSPFKPKKLSI